MCHELNSMGPWRAGRKLEAVASNLLPTFRETFVPNIETLLLPVSNVLSVSVAVLRVSDAVCGVIISWLMLFSESIGIRHPRPHTHFRNLPACIFYNLN